MPHKNFCERIRNKKKERLKRTKEKQEKRKSRWAGTAFVFR
jgi:hypothetical protein